ncbi:DUF4386 domain-containing protein [Paenibacillus methanolicus]|uniref:Uncharacterized protein DUF4386 n=1 Tax=Paenibacillus methanolicus TaxID=582686 RepID=A0A5S5BTN8_9BACL|nr:DUF4386 domain-containing protein [Paenibacillus methanolicus]TYP70545.1 uncharacterized protein DUF4386 [Paenibacillus methanolicus]
MIAQDSRGERRMLALTAGVALLAMAAAAAFAYGYAHGRLLAEGDGAATLHNLQAHSWLLRAELFGWLIILVCDIVAAWALYLFLKPVHPGLALLGAWLRLAYASMLGIAVACLIGVLVLTSGEVDFADVQTPSLALAGMRAFDTVWSTGLIVFGVHLLVVGALALRSADIPRVWGILLLIASAGYIATHACGVFFPQYAGIAAGLEAAFTVPMAAGELGFALWLLLRGGRIGQRPTAL